jgi:predicted GIY-YIG superfamily endonuclease
MKTENDLRWCTYLLECNDGSYYCGCTTNLEKRVKVHNAGKGAAYTRSRLPVALLQARSGLTEGEARKLEYRVKQVAHGKKADTLIHLQV